MFSTVKSKVIVSLLAISIFGLVGMSYYLSSTLHKLSNSSAKHSLNMLSKSIFQTMTTSMMMGDPAVVQKAFSDARKIEGIKNSILQNQELSLKSIPLMKNLQLMHSYSMFLKHKRHRLLKKI